MSTSTPTAISIGVHALLRVVAGREHLDGDQADEADAVTDERRGGALHVEVAERPLWNSTATSGWENTSSATAQGTAKQHHQAQPPVEHEE